jgi:hypothetical protein
MWHFTILQDFQTNLDPTMFQSTVQDAAQNFKEAIRKNRSLLGPLLLKSGATHYALKQLYLTGQARDTRQLTITEENLPRMNHFLRLNQSQSFFCLKFTCQIAFRDFAVCQNYPGNLGRQWLPTFLSLVSAARDRVDTSTCFRKIASEMSQPVADRLPFYMALCIDLIRRDSELVSPFVTHVLAVTVRDDLRQLCIHWLVQLLKYAKCIPSEFLSGLFRANPSNFYLICKHVKALGMCHLDDFVEKAKAQKDL